MSAFGIIEIRVNSRDQILISRDTHTFVNMYMFAMCLQVECFQKYLINKLT